MFYLESTPNHVGVYVAGDWDDLDELYNALHLVIGEEVERYEPTRIRILSICYDIRHARMGQRRVRFVENGLTPDSMRMMGIAASPSNVYYQFEVFWPEMLFVAFALNDYLRDWEKQKNLLPWDRTAAIIRKFQAAVADCLERTLTPHRFALLKRHMELRYSGYYLEYTTQYIDELNLAILAMSPEKRLESIGTMGKRVAEKGKAYQELKQEIYEAARYHDVPPAQIRYPEDYPDEIDW